MADFRVYFPFVWNFGNNPSDGMNGPAVDDPLVAYIVVTDDYGGELVVGEANIRDVLIEDADGQRSNFGEGPYGPEGKKWADVTAAALERLARDIRAGRTEK